MANAGKDDLEKLVPAPLSMDEIVRSMEVWAVRMKRFDRKENTVFGSLVWPEVLVCATEEAAQSLCKFLDDASFQDYMDTIRESDPDASAIEHKDRWCETDIAQYTIEHVSDLSQYPEISRVGESMSVMNRLFPTLEGLAALRRRHRR